MSPPPPLSQALRGGYPRASARAGAPWRAAAARAGDGRGRRGRFYVAASLAVNDALFHVPNFFIFYNLGRLAPARLPAQSRPGGGTPGAAERHRQDAACARQPRVGPAGAPERNPPPPTHTRQAHPIPPGVRVRGKCLGAESKLCTAAWPPAQRRARLRPAASARWRAAGCVGGGA